jgi:light-regulated signal transduction histidine kinase (bacteriophytochrome)
MTTAAASLGQMMETALSGSEKPGTEKPKEIPCADEPIRLPGSIQQHGFFLLTDDKFQRVLAASENVERFLGTPLRLILGTRLDDILQREALAAIQNLRQTHEADREGAVHYLGSFLLHDQLFSIISHRIGAHRALEFELQERLVGPELMNAVITNFVSSLSRLDDQAALCDALTRQIAELTSFDRVLLYSFDQEGHGNVLSEVNNGRLPSYLGLRFPADDIPQQARDLYLLNTVRIIPDSSYTPSPLVAVPGIQAPSIDLSLSVLRSVSPVHLQYMRNMGTASSMSVSIVSEGRLWGLISGHHAEPKVVPYLVRSACDMLSKMGGTQLSSFATAARLRQMVHFHTMQRHVLTGLAAEPNSIDGLINHIDELPEITGAAGVALLVDDHIATSGNVPDHDCLIRLSEWLNTKPEFEILASSRLADELPWAKSICDSASGVLAVRISSLQPRFLLWFRPEVTQTVRWAGEPQKAIEQGHSLHPRASFAEWKELVHGSSEPWTSMEVESARGFRAALISIGLRRAEEAAELGEARFHQLTQAIPIKIFSCDDEGVLNYVNDRWIRNGLGTTGRWFELEGLNSDDAVLCNTRWHEAVETGQNFEAEVRLRTPAYPAERWNLIRAVPFQRAGAARAGWIGTFFDLTESKEREAALRMSEKLALTGRMTSVIAHEINNPLEAITNLMYLLRTELHDDGPATGYIGMVESELERISAITKQTLRWSRETSDQRQRFEIGTMTDDVLRLFAGKIRNRQIYVRFEGDRHTEMEGVIGQIQQVLANLISNAVDAAPVGGRVTIFVITAENQTGFAVEDNGIGIDAALQARLFEPFYSTKGDLGNGLGLYISREIVERHGGRIEVTSTPGAGTTMNVWLPT